MGVYLGAQVGLRERVAIKPATAVALNPVELGKEGSQPLDACFDGQIDDVRGVGGALPCE